MPPVSAGVKLIFFYKTNLTLRLSCTWKMFMFENKHIYCSVFLNTALTHHLSTKGLASRRTPNIFCAHSTEKENTTLLCIVEQNVQKMLNKYTVIFGFYGLAASAIQNALLRRPVLSGKKIDVADYLIISDAQFSDKLNYTRHDRH